MIGNGHRFGSNRDDRSARPLQVGSLIRRRVRPALKSERPDSQTRRYGRIRPMADVHLRSVDVRGVRAGFALIPRNACCIRERGRIRQLAKAVDRRPYQELFTSTSALQAQNPIGELAIEFDVLFGTMRPGDIGRHTVHLKFSPRLLVIIRSERTRENAGELL